VNGHLTLTSFRARTFNDTAANDGSFSLLGAAAMAGTLSMLLAGNQEVVYADSGEPVKVPEILKKDKSDIRKFASARTKRHQGKLWPVYSSAEVLQMQDTDRIWVSYDDGVYDVTDFVSHHPGGLFIMMANGGALEAFWSLYRVHFKRSVYNLLERFRVGVLREEDRINFDDIEDPFNQEPIRHPGLIVLRQKPFDAETPLHHLAQDFYTRNNVFYVRNHFPVPSVEEPEEHEIDVSVPPELGGEDRTFTLKEIMSNFKKHAIDCALFCTGFRAKEMTGDVYDAQGGQMGNARWAGYRLRDLLKACGLDEEAVFSTPADLENNDDIVNYHVHLTGLDGYSISIPLEIALGIERDVMVVTEMNGKRLPRDHGFPCRVLVPSFVGARSVKWITNIEVKPFQSDSPFHTNIYRLWPKDVHTHEEALPCALKLCSRCLF